MTNHVANTRISNLVETQLPFFVRNDHQNFVRFVEAYYEWMEQQGQTLDTAKNFRDYLDIDQSIDQFTEHFYSTFLKYIPKDSAVDRTLLLKHVKDFYRARGTEKSIEFLMRLLFGEETLEFYYPKRDVLKASDGKWFVEKSLKVSDIVVNGVANSDIQAAKSFTGRKIRGNTSNATALVERVDVYYQSGVLVDELKISNQTKDFVSGETIFTTFFDQNGVEKTLTADLFSGEINNVDIINPGTKYKVGDVVTIEANTGKDGLIVVSSVTTGNIASISVVDGGAGFQINNAVLITGGGGTEAVANVVSVNASGFYHPNSYNVVSSTISLEANTPINNTVYSNLNSSNINTTIANAVSYWTYANTGPLTIVYLINSGRGFTTPPSISATANTQIRNLGILGKMRINNGGTGYQVGDLIKFENVPGGYGTGAAANVAAVAANGAITEVHFIPVSGHYIGGAGYDQNYLPRANIVSTAGVGANIAVTALLGFGDSFSATTGTIGSIISLSIVNRGSGYTYKPTLNLTQIGDGTAQVSANIITGAFIYPGRYINDDGHVSGYNFIQDRDYYQNNSYVIRIKRSIDQYRQALKELVHPAGMKLFGEYIFGNDDPSVNVSLGGITESSIYLNALRQYRLSPDLTISYPNHGLSQNTEITLQFQDSAFPDDIYRVSNVINANAFTAIAPGTKLPATANLNTLAAVGTLQSVFFSPSGNTVYGTVSSGSEYLTQVSLTKAYDVGTISTLKQSPTLVSSGMSLSTGMSITDDGKKVLIVGSLSDSIIQYNLTEAWNVQTLTYEANISISGIDTSATGIQIRPNGNGAYIMGKATGKVYQLAFESGNVKNATVVSSQTITPTSSYFEDLFISNDGKRMLILDSNDTYAGVNAPRVLSYNLAEAWNVNTAVYTTTTGNLAARGATQYLTKPTGISMSPDGKIMYISQYKTGGALITQMILKEAWNVNTAMYSTTASNGTVVVVGKIG